MKKYLVIGNPINHSLSPKLHTYWLKKHKIQASYEKINIEENDIQKIISDLRKQKINGINVTVPFKKKIIPYLDKLTPLSQETQSVNTVYKEQDQIVGHNTDVAGFELGIRSINYDVKKKKNIYFRSGGSCSIYNSCT